MNTITIPKKMASQDDLIVVPRKQYEKLARFWASTELLSKSQTKAISKGFREIRQGKFFTSKNVKHELGL